MEHRKFRLGLWLATFCLGMCGGSSYSWAERASRQIAANFQNFETGRKFERNPNTLSVEVLGRGGLYSLNYDRSVSDSVSLGLGFSYLGAQAGPGQASLVVVPLYTNLYLFTASHRLFLTGALDFIHLSGSFNTTSLGSEIPLSPVDIAGRASFVLPVFGGGYEFRGTGGLLFRLSAYFIPLSNVPCIGCSFGGAY